MRCLLLAALLSMVLPVHAQAMRQAAERLLAASPEAARAKHPAPFNDRDRSTGTTRRAAATARR
jgi:hypothetical protein